MVKSKTLERRNKKNIGFSEEERAEIAKKAKKAGLYPRQYIMLLVRNDR
jgi:hypothetical protein